jgi:hypothetical protein
MSKQLLIEYLPFVVRPELIKESIRSNSGRLIVSGVLQRANAKNQNGRVYPKPILEREVNRYMQNEIAQRRALGELDHPDSSIVNLRNVSHNIVECYWEGDDLMGKVEILGTPSGNILRELFNAGVTLGISSRGLGSVKSLHEADDQTVEVQPDFELITFDFVSNPSTQGAFLKPVDTMAIGEGLLRENTQRLQEFNKYNKADTLIRDIICELSGVCCI